MEFSFLHIADIHLDRPFSGLSDFSLEAKSEQIYKTAIERAFNNVIDIAIMKNVDFVLIAGDTFDSCEQDFSSKLILKKGLQKLIDAQINVYMVCGNHDPLNSYSRNTFNYDENSPVKIIGLNTGNDVELPVTNKSGETVAKLHAFSFSDENCYDNPVIHFKRAETGFNIGLLHCDLNAGKDSPYAPCLPAELKELNYDYFALGHIHIPSLNEGNIQYSGTIQGRNTKETGAHGIRYIKVTDNKIVKNIFIPVDIIRFEDITIDITSANSAVDVFDIIEEKISETISKESDSAEIFLIRPFLIGCCTCYSEINEDFLNNLSEKIKVDFSQKVFISQAECNISPKIDENVLNGDAGISGEIYRSVNNDEIIKSSFNIVEESLGKFIANCDFTQEEYQKFSNDIIKSAKEECKNLCNEIYENIGVN